MRSRSFLRRPTPFAAGVEAGSTRRGSCLMLLLLFLSSWQTARAQFDFGNDGGTSSQEECSGSGAFQQPIAFQSRLVVGDIPSGLQGLLISMTSQKDVDIQLTSTNVLVVTSEDEEEPTEVINWTGGIITEGLEVTKTWNGDSITYSGYNGVNDAPGNEFVVFNDETSNSYRMYAYGYQAGLATVEYSWTGRVGCDNNSAADAPTGPDPYGNGTFQQTIAEGAVVIVGDLPAGLRDVYVRLDSPSDIDIQLFDGEIAVVDWQQGYISASGFERKDYDGLQISYSGFNGEQRGDSSFGQEYILIEGVLPRTFSLRVLGYQSGTADVTYSWGYYTTATGTEGSLEEQLHEIIDNHMEISYTPGCWDALKRIDQDKNDPDKVILFYSRRSELKDNQDRGTNDPDSWNREHIWAKSHGNFGTSRGPGTDLHALRAADRSVNMERSAKDFASGGAALSSDDPREDCPTCLETSDSFEPPDEIKGDVARMIFYMAVRYNGDEGSSGVSLTVVNGVGTPYGGDTKDNGEIGDLSSLMAWHILDPVSDEERHRNNIIYDIQGNRNPFIDRPEFVDIVFSKYG